VILRIKLRDSTSSSAAGLNGLSGSSAGLIISTIADNESSATAYTQAAGHIQTIAALGTYVAPAAASCRFSQVDATNHPGVYELQFADARFAVSGAKSLLVSLSGATNLVQCDVLVPLRTVDPFVASGIAPVSVTTNNDKTGYALAVTPPTVAAIATTIWQDLVASGDFGTAGSIGALLKADINAPIGSIPTNPFTGTPPTAAQIATAVWTDVTGGDFTTAGTPGKILVAQLGGAFTSNTSSVYSAPALANAPSGGGSAPTAAQIATAVWQDAVSGDFTVAGSIGKSLFTGGNVPGAPSGLSLVGSNMGSVTSISGVSFPARFAALAIDANGNVTYNNTNVVNANLVQINATAVKGNGSTIPWGPN
jgi:hypothetical protein